MNKFKNLYPMLIVTLEPRNDRSFVDRKGCIMANANNGKRASVLLY